MTLYLKNGCLKKKKKTQSHNPPCTQRHVHTHTHTQRHVRTHTHTHTHIANCTGSGNTPLIWGYESGGSDDFITFPDY